LSNSRTPLAFAMTGFPSPNVIAACCSDRTPAPNRRATSQAKTRLTAMQPAAPDSSSQRVRQRGASSALLRVPTATDQP